MTPPLSFLSSWIPWKPSLDRTLYLIGTTLTQISTLRGRWKRKAILCRRGTLVIKPTPTPLCFVPSFTFPWPSKGSWLLKSEWCGGCGGCWSKRKNSRACGWTLWHVVVPSSTRLSPGPIIQICWPTSIAWYYREMWRCLRGGVHELKSTNGLYLAKYRDIKKSVVA